MLKCAFLRWWVNNFTINYFPSLKCLILLVVQLLTAKLDIQVLYGRYYLCTNLDTMLEIIARRAVVEFYKFSSRFTLTVREPILGEEKVLQSLEGAT